ncbi:helix-turn-helix domain-containing protein [Oleiagrimonas citrea]|nr:helix-turn-helix domain-containing protein [Oleiagrimonas citrea]
MNQPASTNFTDQERGEHDFSKPDDDQGASPGFNDEAEQWMSSAEAEPSFGCHLRAVREEQGLSLQDCAQALHLPARLLEKLEQDNYAGIDYSVYLRSYLSKYAAYVGMGSQEIEDQLERLRPRQPELITTSPLSGWQRTIDRYSSAATYVVLTAVIVAPLIWLGLNGVLKRDIAQLAPLDAAPVNAQSTALASTAVAASGGHEKAPAPGGNVSGLVPPTPPSEKPLMASIAPFSAMEASKKARVTTSAAAPPQTSAATHLTLKLRHDSWVEITDTNGKRLEYGLLPAGTDKSYRSTHPLEVRIGNADGANVAVDGKPLSLGKFQRANVAHFNVADGGAVRPASG